MSVALACAFILKRFQISAVREDEHAGGIAYNGPIYEITIVIMSAYLAYLVAEVRHPRSPMRHPHPRSNDCLI